MVGAVIVPPVLAATVKEDGFAEKFAVITAEDDVWVTDVERLLILAISAVPAVTVHPVKVYPAEAAAVIVVVDV